MNGLTRKVVVEQAARLLGQAGRLSGSGEPDPAMLRRAAERARRAADLLEAAAKGTQPTGLIRETQSGSLWTTLVLPSGAHELIKIESEATAHALGLHEEKP